MLSDQIRKRRGRPFSDPIEDLDSHDEMTVTTRQAALWLEITIRDVQALVRCGMLAKQPRGTREFHILTDSLRQFDRLRFKRSA